MPSKNIKRIMKVRSKGLLPVEYFRKILRCSRYNTSPQQRERITLTNISCEQLQPSHRTSSTADQDLNFITTNFSTDSSWSDKTKYSKLSRSISMMVHKPGSKVSRRTQSLKIGKQSAHQVRCHHTDPGTGDTDDGTLHKRCTGTCQRKRSKVDVGVQTRFSLNTDLIKEVEDLIKDELEVDPNDENSESDWSESDEENEDDSSTDTHQHVLENGEGDCHFDSHDDQLTSPQKYAMSPEAEPDSNIQRVLPSLQSRRGAVHSGVNISDPKEKFKIPNIWKRKNDRKWSKNELSNIMKNIDQDKPHPLNDLVMSHWSELMSEDSHPELKSEEYKHRDALWGLFRAELVYLTDQLKVIKDVFQGTLKTAKDNGFLCDIDESTLFPNVNKLYKVSNSFSLDLYRMFTEGNASDDSVVTALHEFAKKFHQPYQRYCLNYTRAAKYLKSLEKQRSDFRDYEKVCQEDNRCKKRQLSDLLICPMQHLMRYVILLEDIAKHVPDTGRGELRDAISTIQDSLRSLESKLGTLQNFQRLQELDNILIWPKIDSMDKTVVIPDELKDHVTENQSTLCSDGRHILHAGSLYLLENPKSTEVYTFLFDDMLLLTRSNSSLRKRSVKSEHLSSTVGNGLVDAFDTSGGLYDPEQRYLVYKQPISLEDIQIHNISSAPGGCKHCFTIATYNRLKYCTGLFTFNAVTSVNKTLWLSKLRKASEEFLISHPVAPSSRGRYDSNASTNYMNNNTNTNGAASSTADNSSIGSAKSSNNISAYPSGDKGLKDTNSLRLKGNPTSSPVKHKNTKRSQSS